MAKNKQVIYLMPPNKYAGGSFLSGLSQGLKDSFAKPDWKSLGQGAAGGLISGAGSMIGGLAGSAISGGLESGAGSIIGGLGDVAAAIPGPWGAVASAGLKVVGGLVNRAFGSKLNQENINKVNSNINQMTSFNSNAGSFDALAENMSNQPAAMGFNKSFIGKDGWFSSKAKRKFNALKAEQRRAQDWVESSLDNNADNLRENQGLGLLANYAAFGGPLDFGLMPIGGAIDYELANKRLQIMSDKNKEKTSTPVYAFGGAMPSNGADWTNGVVIVGNGGTHEENPFEGVQMGTAPDGRPNLVEEGEVVYKDYVFSNRIRVPKSVREKYKLKGKEGMTFADAAKKAQKESEERPNDPISARSLEDIMGKLMIEQEGIREKRASRKYAHGGQLGLLYDGTGSGSQFLQFYTPAAKMARQLGITPKLTAPTMQPFFIPGTNVKNPNYGKPSMPNIDLSDWKKGTLFDERTSQQKWFDDNVKPVKLSSPALGGSIDGGSEEEDPTEISNNPLKALRFIPAFGAGLGVMTDLFGLTNKPDYTNAGYIQAAIDSTRMRDVRATPIGDYMRYTPLDRLFYANQLGAQAAGTRRGILNTSGGNRGAAMAGLLAADYNAQNSLGNLFRQAEEYNLSQREKVSTFNRATNMFNSEQDLKAQIANAEQDGKRASISIDAAGKIASLRQAADDRASAARSANLTNLFDSLGDIGREAFAMDMIKNNRGLLYDWMGRYKGKILDDADGKKANGGYLTIKPKRRK